MISDAEAHHYQRMQILLDLRPFDDIFCQIHKYWRVLIKKFRTREAYLLKQLAYLDRLFELVGLAEELETIWTHLLNQCPTENNIAIWENKYNASAEKVSNMSFDWSFIAQTKSEHIVGCCYARFWGINLAIGCILLCYKKFFLETKKSTDLICEICKSMTTVKVRFVCIIHGSYRPTQKDKSQII